MAVGVWAVLVGYVVTGAGVAATVWQKQMSEARARKEQAEREARNEWWRRYQWAAELATSDNPRRQALGLEVLDSLVNSPLATDSEADLIATVAVGRARRDNENEVEEDEP